MVDFIEMFCGIGGFRLGLEKANQVCGEFRNTEKRNGEAKASFKSSQTTSESVRPKGDFTYPQQSRNTRKVQYRCVWANDIDKYACQIYRKNFGEKELVEADIRTVNVDSIPRHRLLTAGFPCQAFSVAGKRKGFGDTRGTLFYEICRVAEAKRPEILLLENVKGLLSHDEGLTFQIILESLEELGYWCEWQVLNSKHFGVPQNRERVFLVGHLGNRGGREVFPVFQASTNPRETRKKTQRKRTRIRTANPLGVGGSFGERNLIYAHPQNFERKALFKENEALSSLRTIQRPPHTRAIANTLSHRYGKDGSENLVMLAHTKANIRQREQNRNDTWCLEGTGNYFGVKQTQRIRRLTPVECERLQGFPDNWTQGISDTQRYKCLGNAVTVNVIEYLGQQILNVIEK